MVFPPEQPIDPHAADTTPLPFPDRGSCSSESEVELRRLRSFQIHPTPTPDQRESDPDGIMKPLALPVETPVQASSADPREEG